LKGQTEGEQKVNARAVLQKTGKMKFISHLDLMRCVMRSFRIAELPVSFSKGFTPHPKISFINALPLGQESLCEPFDFSLDEDRSFEDIRGGLNAAFPAGIAVSEVYEARDKAADLWEAEYIINIRTDREVPCLRDKKDIMTAIEGWYSREEIIIEKKGKNGKLRQLDIKPMVRILSLEENPSSVDMTVRLPNGSRQNLNPQIMVNSLKSFNCEPLDVANIRKLQIFCENGEIFR
jgi:radical SAM-linked protein